MARTKKKQCPLVSVVMGSDSDLPTMWDAVEFLMRFDISHEVRVFSAHRASDATVRYAKNARTRGVKIIIAGAGGAAHLAGVIAANTTIPVIGVPMMTSSFKGMDSLLSTLQMPSGIPVATMSVGSAGARNAAICAVQILALENNNLQKELGLYKRKLAAMVKKKDAKLKSVYDKSTQTQSRKTRSK